MVSIHHFTTIKEFIPSSALTDDHGNIDLYSTFSYLTEAPYKKLTNAIIIVHIGFQIKVRDKIAQRDAY